MTVKEAVKQIEDALRDNLEQLTKTEQLTVVRHLVTKLTNLEATIVEEIDPE